ncbi:maltose ABC transporter permease MalF [Niveibacterium umoris]|uniref:Maltose/maltodextrin transport system permease protein n=1 Tax=Niveibacterium umoris TaxID=1193620 RepID=A0A840BHV7_9RHOO|nr:maltose ABC transporter permease MalF [Niveibacterium umoris]MBB4013131.1 maltose/maltodextrin transport system permease protein [Niveibacterium umoris]
MKRSYLHMALAALGAVSLLAGFALVVVFYMARQPMLAIGALAMIAAAVWVYVSPRFYAWRYVVPGIFAALLFIVLPMAYTLTIGFTNYSSAHLLSFERATEVLVGRTVTSGEGMSFKLYPEQGGAHRLVFADDNDHLFTTGPVKLGKAQRVPVAPLAAEPQGEAATLKDVIALKAGLSELTAVMPDGTEMRLSSLRRFSAMHPAYARNKDGSLTDAADGSILTPDFKRGNWVRANGEAVEPGFRVYVGLENYVQIFKDQRFFEPFGRVFGWTVSFAGINTVLTFAIGILLATAMNWDALRYRNFYRLMLFLPYAVPAFISIPVFRGLFNENLGEINMVLDMFFGVRPSWFSDATLARSMVLIVNTWLGYPYMMILCMGLIKAIPSELYEASALAGAGPLTNFFRITLPLISRPIAPLLIASFAFNFNNLTLIALLTNGAPDYLDTQVPVGATDLLASYTYRIAFQDSGQNYALACAIASIVFLIVATLAVVNLRLFKVNDANA